METVVKWWNSRYAILTSAHAAPSRQHMTAGPATVTLWKHFCSSYLLRLLRLLRCSLFGSLRLEPFHLAMAIRATISGELGNLPGGRSIRQSLPRRCVFLHPLHWYLQSDEDRNIYKSQREREMCVCACIYYFIICSTNIFLHRSYNTIQLKDIYTICMRSIHMFLCKSYDICVHLDIHIIDMYHAKCSI